MKKTCLLALLCLPFVQLKAQDGVVFKVKYLPNHDYQIGIKVGVKINATVSGSQQVTDFLSAQGITQPVNVVVNVGMSGDSKTGSKASDGSFPLNMNYKIGSFDLTVNGKPAPIPTPVEGKSFSLVGRVISDTQIHLDSAMGKKLDDSTQKKTQQMMTMLQKQIKFPEKALKPGDSFTENIPMGNIPMKGGSDVKAEGGVTYKLISISDGKAYFDMTPHFSMSFVIKTLSVNLTGEGAGKMVYSIKDNFPVSKEGTFSMKVKVTSDKVNVDATAEVTTSYTAAVN
ncbi:MAG: hypothetical protein ACHQHN_03675 [Sphingobacteriales bacterium]